MWSKKKYHPFLWFRCNLNKKTNYLSIKQSKNGGFQKTYPSSKPMHCFNSILIVIIVIIQELNRWCVWCSRKVAWKLCAPRRCKWTQINQLLLIFFFDKWTNEPNNEWMNIWYRVVVVWLWLWNIEITK